MCGWRRFLVHLFVPLDAPLSRRQLDVLRWIRDGCPDGRWTDFTFKTTATALASRRLVTVSKRRGIWSASILPAGRHYLTNSAYPEGRWRPRRGRRPSVVEVPPRAAAVAQHPVPAVASATTDPSPTKAAAPPVGLTPTRKLLKQLIDAGGILEIDTNDDPTSYRSLVGIINRRRMAADGQAVLIVPGRSYHHLVLRLSSVSDWQTRSPSEVVAAERIGRWHPAVATLRDGKRLDSIGKRLRRRAFRLLHALACEGEARGYSVRIPPRNGRGYAQNSKLGGDLVFTVDDIECSVSIWQPNDRIDHIPTPEEIERNNKYSWASPQQYDYVPSNRLTIAIDTTSRYSSKQSWTETKTVSLQLRLPDVMTTFQQWSIIDAERRETERRREIERQQRRAREDKQARDAYIQHTLGQRLIADATNWELAGRLRRYLDEMAVKVKALEDVEARSVAAAWLAWSEDYARQLDPLTRPIRPPLVKEPDYAELQQSRQRLGFATT